MRVVLTIYAILITCVLLTAQSDEDARMIKNIHNNILTDGHCYDWLYHLSEEVGGRLAGSAESIEAVDYTAEVLSSLSDTIYKQYCTVPYWTRGRAEQVTITNLEIGLDEVRALGRDEIEGKIVFFNRPMDPTQIRTFFAYGGAADQRVNGPAVAAEYGAVGTLVRSLTTLTDDIPHTGVTRYKDGVPEIPAVAISTMDADRLSTYLKQQEITVRVETHCQMVDLQKPSYNVVAEIKGSMYPDEIILVGGHLDSWDVGGGAHDDGAGCVHAMEVFNAFKKLNYQPKRTIRCVLFMNEENGLGGGLAYAAASNANGEYHMAAIESEVQILIR